MKKLLVFASAFILLGLTACDKDDDNSSIITTTNVTSTVSSGTWRVTYYWDTDHEETSNYNGFNFIFSSGGILNASNTLFGTSGTWVTGIDDSKVKLVITFTSPASFVELSEDWEVTARTDTKVTLRHISGGGGGTDYLTFEKN